MAPSLQPHPPMTLMNEAAQRLASRIREVGTIMTSIKWAKLANWPLTALAMAALTWNVASAQGTLRIGMTASDIPLTTGQTDQGGEGMRFMGYTVYDGLVNWDLSSFDKPSDLVPGLADELRRRSRRRQQDPMDLQDPRRREVPRRLRVHRRRGGLELRQAAQERQPAIRPAPVRAGPLAHSGRGVLQGGRQIHARDRHQVARRDPCPTSSPGS